MSTTKATRRRSGWEHSVAEDGSILVPLTQGKFSCIDEQDLPMAKEYTWHSHRVKRQGRDIWYAVARSGRKLLRMHRLILNAPEDMDVDHKDGDGLNNRRSNLRLCTKTQNRGNQHTTRGKSRFRGVWFFASRNKWCAMIAHNRKRYNLGYFDTEEEAARAYDRKARELFGEFASPNFPGESEPEPVAVASEPQGSRCRECGGCSCGEYFCVNESI